MGKVHEKKKKKCGSVINYVCKEYGHDYWNNSQSSPLIDFANLVLLFKSLTHDTFTAKDIFSSKCRHRWKRATGPYSGPGSSHCH